MSPDDIIVWPDGTWCRREDLAEYTWMSDDYQVYSRGTKEAEEIEAEDRL